MKLLRWIKKLYPLLLLISILQFCVLSNSAQAGSVTLAWDANTEEDLSGYKIHYGTESGVYTTTIIVGNVTQFTIPDMEEDVTYFYALTAHDSEDYSSEYSDEISHMISSVVIVLIPATNFIYSINCIDTSEEFIIEAESGNIVAPMQIGSMDDTTYVFTDTKDSGSISFTFNIIDAGQYQIKAKVNSRDQVNQDSFYVGLDGETINSNYHVYDTSLVSTFTWDTVSLRGETGTVTSSDLDPMIYTLSEGLHIITFHGRETDTWLDKISIRKL